MWSRALRKHRAAIIEPPWNIGIAPVRGNLIVCLGAPGVGKSLFSLNWALALPTPSLIVSLDTDLRSQAVRAASILTGTASTLVERHPDAYSLYLERQEPMCRIYDLQVSPQNINELALAEEEYWGVSPTLIVVDNISNIVKDMSYESYRQVFIELQKVARMRDAVVLALHHVRREASEGRLKLHSGQYAGEQEAEIVLGLWRGVNTSLEVGVLKNRNGQADPSGNLSFSLPMNHKNLRLG